MKRVAAVVVLATLIIAPAYADSAFAQSDEITPGDIAAADDRRRAVGRELASASAEYDASAHRVHELEESLGQLVTELTFREGELEQLRAEAELVTREAYMSAGARDVVILFDAESINEIPVRHGYLQFVTQNEAAVINRLEAVRSSYEDQQIRLDLAVSEQEQLTDVLEVLASEIYTQLEAADAEYRAVLAAYEAQEAEKRRIEEERRRREEEERRRREEEERRRATTTTTGVGDTTSTTVGDDTTTTTTQPPPPPPPDGGMACPVDGATTFTDSFGAPRSGGRRHQGVDMMAARGTPLVAIETSTVIRMGNGGLGGITVWLRAPSGDTYYYAHLDGWAPGLGVGDSLAVGELLGYVGNTGNAVYTSPHLHFEYHPGGGAAVNPYPLVRDLCL